jgi:hypothetical protein
MTLTQETDYPPTSTIRVRNAKAVQSPLRVSTENGTQATEFRLNSPWDILYAPVDQQHPKRVALVYGPTVLVKGQKRLSADSLPRFSRPEQKLKFEMRPNGEHEFVPFTRSGFTNPTKCTLTLVNRIQS